MNNSIIGFWYKRYVLYMKWYIVFIVLSLNWLLTFGDGYLHSVMVTYIRWWLLTFGDGYLPSVMVTYIRWSHIDILRIVNSMLAKRDKYLRCTLCLHFQIKLVGCKSYIRPYWSSRGEWQKALYVSLFDET